MPEMTSKNHKSEDSGDAEVNISPDAYAIILESWGKHEPMNQSQREIKT